MCRSWANSRMGGDERCECLRVCAALHTYMEIEQDKETRVNRQAYARAQMQACVHVSIDPTFKKTACRHACIHLPLITILILSCLRVLALSVLLIEEADEKRGRLPMSGVPVFVSHVGVVDRRGDQGMDRSKFRMRASYTFVYTEQHVCAQRWPDHARLSIHIHMHACACGHTPKLLHRPQRIEPEEAGRPSALLLLLVVVVVTVVVEAGHHHRAGEAAVLFCCSVFGRVFVCVSERETSERY